MNMEKDPQDAGGGMDRPGDFSRLYLPLHRQELAARKMQDFLDRLSESTRLEEVRQQDLLLALRENREALSSMPTIWPVVGFVSSSFGWRSSPFGGRGQFHKGLDITNRVGTPVVAPAQGAVTFSGTTAPTASAWRSTTAAASPPSTAICSAAPYSPANGSNAARSSAMWATQAAPPAPTCTTRCASTGARQPHALHPGINRRISALRQAGEGCPPLSGSGRLPPRLRQSKTCQRRAHGAAMKGQAALVPPRPPAP